MAMITPFPAARPSALTTTGGSIPSTYAFASSKSSKRLAAPVGMPCLSMRPFANCLLPSSLAAAFDGPNTLRPASAKWSATPATRGASGPTTVRSTSRAAAMPASATGSIDVGGDALGELGHPAVSGYADDIGNRRTAGELPREGVLPAASPNNHDPHRSLLLPCGRASRRRGRKSYDEQGGSNSSRYRYGPSLERGGSRSLPVPYRLAPLRADRDYLHRDAGSLLDELHVLDRGGRKLSSRRDPRDVIAPARELEVLGLALVEDRLVRREIVVDPALVGVAHAYLQDRSSSTGRRAS